MMSVKYLNKKTVIIGIGITGLSCVRFFLDHGIIPRIMDTREFPPELNHLPEGIEYYVGGLYEPWLLTATCIVVSPGVSLYHPFLVKAAKFGIEIIGDVELFMREVTKPVVAITGSNGKSTVVSLLYKMANKAGFCVGVGGNIGMPVLPLLSNKKYQFYILELSSFQLETISTFKFFASTILNITEDHLDRYPCGFKQYCKIKLKIYRNINTICVLNADDNYFGLLDNFLDRRCISFGVSSGDYHIKFIRGYYWLMFHDEKLINCSEIKLKGMHNYINILAALALASVIKIPLNFCLEVLRRFYGLPHRFQIVNNKGGAYWINDSKSTNVASTRSAVINLNVSKSLHLLMGGCIKSDDFSLLKHCLHKIKVKIYCFGRDGEYLSSCFSKFNDVVLTNDMEESIHIIHRRLIFGDLVLLSPACSSLDQFKNYKDRGNKFKYFSKGIN